MERLRADNRKPSRVRKIALHLTQKEAEALGIVFCKCGHPPNNHFIWGKGECARCECEEYRQTIRIPKPIDRESEEGAGHDMDRCNKHHIPFKMCPDCCNLPEDAEER